MGRQKHSKLLWLAKNAGDHSQSLAKFLLLSQQVLLVLLSFVQQRLQATWIHQLKLVHRSVHVSTSPQSLKELQLLCERVDLKQTI